MKTSLVGADLGQQEFRFRGGAQTPDQSLYLVPYSAESIICYNTTTDRTDYIKGHFPENYRWIEPILTHNNNIIAAPYNTTQFIKVIPYLNWNLLGLYVKIRKLVENNRAIRLVEEVEDRES